jgi:putative transposase
MAGRYPANGIFSTKGKNGVKWKKRREGGQAVFNFITTSNHVHLLLLDESGHEAIPKFMQLVAGCTAQE